MIVLRGFDPVCAAVMRDACGFQDDDSFIERARETEFYGLYDPEPVGAILIDEQFIHVGSLKPCGFAFRRIVNDVLTRRPFLIAAIEGDRPRAVKLAKGMGFGREMKINSWTLLRRDA